MTDLPRVPLFLQPGRAAALNDKLVRQTGCFAFLKTDQVAFTLSPKSYQDAFISFSIGLYALYHDFGCYFLQMLLSDQFCPSSIDTGGLVRYRTHVSVLNRDIRSNLAHGLLELEPRIRFQKKLAGYYLHSEYTGVSAEQWPDFVNNLTQEQWKSITATLIADSDRIYHFLERWADEWAKDSDSLDGLRNRFATDTRFSGSFGDRICRSLIRKHNNVVDPGQYISYSNTSASIYTWRSTLQNDFLSGKITRPEELYKHLDQMIDKTVNPPAQTSLSIAERYGFGIPL